MGDEVCSIVKKVENHSYVDLSFYKNHTKPKHLSAVECSKNIVFSYRLDFYKKATTNLSIITVLYNDYTRK